ncbi:MAG: saccharopine dehydrogenase NADP-binding domain-containing protein [Nitrospirae bacterium]|nr:saccharopine dehydrogenase NADP-binding domain-containing protein [Nitrospirota bacterium]
MTREGLLIYGAYGYTGELVARWAVRKGLRPLLAGRDGAKVRLLAETLGLESLAFPLDDAAALSDAVAKVRVVVHCAGPFIHTSELVAGACLKQGAHYLDITGEVDVFEALAARDAEAREAGVMLMPGVGFDVVPSDCLAVHLRNRLPSATHLALAFSGLGAGFSRGTLTTMVEHMHRGGLARQRGALVPVPPAWKTRRIDFGLSSPLEAVTLPWGDLSAAFVSTGIPNIETYAVLPGPMRLALQAGRLAGPLLKSNTLREVLKMGVRAGQAGPTEAERARGFSVLWGEASDEHTGLRVVSRLRTPEGYTLTAMTAVLIAQKVVAGEAPAGFQTPAKAYGPDLILEFEGIERTDV